MRPSTRGSSAPTSARRLARAPGSSPSSAWRKTVCSSGSGRIGHPHTGDTLGGARLSDERFERRQVLVPFDETGHEAETVERLFKKTPDRFRDDRGVVVDQNLRAPANDARMPREMNFADEGLGQGFEISIGFQAEVGAGDEDVVDIEENAAAR